MNDPMTVVEKCQTCSTVYDIVVEAQDYYDWARGAKYLQDAFPYLTADERELLLSHTCGPCFNAMFPEEDEEVV